MQGQVLAASILLACLVPSWLIRFLEVQHLSSYPESLGRGGEEGCFTCGISTVCPLPLSLSAKPLGGRKPPSFPSSGSSQSQRQASPWRINSPKAHAAEDHFAKWSPQQTIIEELFELWFYSAAPQMLTILLKNKRAFSQLSFLSSLFGGNNIPLGL